MEIKLDETQIKTAIQEHLDKFAKDGVSYKVKDAMDQAISAAITPEIVSSYAAAAVKALTDPSVTERIVKEMHEAIGEGVRMAMQEAIVSVAARLRGYRPNGNSDDVKKIEDLRTRLFPAK